jgi:urease accessory protein
MAQSRLAARFAPRSGRTRLIEHQQNAPLKIARTFEATLGGLDLCVMDASPGLLAGDDYEFDWHLEESARVRITTQGATRVHPARECGSTQTTHIHVAAGAHLEFWPESVIPFTGARFTSRTEAFLEDGARFILFESLSAGRVARGEKFGFELVDSRVLVRDSRGPLLCARNRFAPADSPLDNPFSWGSATQWSNLYAFGGISAAELEKARHILHVREVYGSASLLNRGGIAVSMLGQRAHDLRCVALEIGEVFSTPFCVSRETT